MRTRHGDCLVHLPLSMNKKYSRTGTLFQRRMKKVSVNSDPKLISLIHYIHHNPIHHGFCTDFSDWPYSSIVSFLYLDLSTFQKQYLIWLGGGNLKQGIILFQKSHQEFKLDMKSIKDLEFSD